jgi:nucleoside-diphosphate-sugar epimerase
MAEPRRILVLGAGELGTAVLRHLAAQRDASAASVTVLLRESTIHSTDTAKRAEIEALVACGVELLAGDLAHASEAQLAALFSPFDTVIGCTGFVAGRGTQLLLARAVLVAGVRFYIPWQFGVDYDAIGTSISLARRPCPAHPTVGPGSAQDLFDEQLAVRALLRAQTRTRWAILSTGMFTSFLFWPPFGVVDAAADPPVVRALGAWDNRVTLTTAEDIGRATAALVFGAGVEEGVVYAAGDTVTYAQVADIVEAATGRTVQRSVRDVHTLQEELRRAPADELAKYRVVFAQGTGVAWDVATSFTARLGMSTTDARTWAMAHFNSGR